MFSVANIDVKIRCLVLFQDAQWTAANIACTLKKPVRTIRDWVSKIKKGIDITKVRQGRGKKPSIEETKKDKIVRTALRRVTRSSTRTLASQYEVSKGSAYNILLERGCNYGNIRKVPHLDDDAKEERIKYCRNMLKRRAKPLEETFYADEMGISLYDTVKSKGWSGPRKKLKVELPDQNVKVSCWGAISERGGTSLHIYKDTLKRERYEDIVIEHYEEMQDLYPDGFTYQHDNLKLHHAAEPALEDYGFCMVPFPRFSPDLTPIENLWKALKDRVSNDNPKSESQMVSSLHRNWEILTEPENLAPYFSNLYDRFQDCIKKKGERLPY